MSQNQLVLTTLAENGGGKSCVSGRGRYHSEYIGMTDKIAGLYMFLLSLSKKLSTSVSEGLIFLSFLVCNR